MAQPKDTSSDKGAMRIDPKLVRELAQLLTDNELTEIEVADGERRIKVKREPGDSRATYCVASLKPIAETIWLHFCCSAARNVAYSSGEPGEGMPPTFPY